MEELKPLNYTGIPEGYFVVGVITPEYNCVVEKVLGEMGPYLKQHMIHLVIGNEESPRTIIEYMPETVLYLRCGTKIPTHPNILVTVDGHIQYFRSMEIPVIYYLDDAFFQANNFAPLKILMNCDETIVATSALVEHLVKADYKRPIHLLKTHMDIPAFDMCPPSNAIMNNDKFNILFTSEGRIGTMMLNRICERMSLTPEKYKGCRIICVCSQVAMLRAAINKWRGIEKVYFERVPLFEYYGIYKMSDLVLAPGEPGDLNYFLEEADQPEWLASKSCVKYTVAGAAGIPCIASPWLKEYEMAITHGETGYIANEIDEWMQYIDLMMVDSDKRIEIGNKARMDVIKNWHIHNRAEEFANILKGQSTCKVQ